MKTLLLLGAFLTPQFSHADEYHVHSKLSAAHFNIIEEGQQFGGLISRMTGTVSFDEKDFSSFKAKINMDTKSIILTPPFSSVQFPKCLDGQSFPLITFESTYSKIVDEKQFLAYGNL